VKRHTRSRADLVPSESFQIAGGRRSLEMIRDNGRVERRNFNRRLPIAAKMGAVARRPFVVRSGERTSIPGELEFSVSVDIRVDRERANRRTLIFTGGTTALPARSRESCLLNPAIKRA